MSRFLSAEQAAELSGVHPKTVRRWIASGRLKANKRGRAYRIRLEDLAPFMGHDGERPGNGEHAGQGIGDIGDRGQSGPSGQDGLLELVRELQAQVVQHAATAAMWQARAETLGHQLRALQAPTGAPESHTAPNLTAQGSEAPRGASEPDGRSWWRRWWETLLSAPG
jgi:excisionase family DNA binding protein